MNIIRWPCLVLSTTLFSGFIPALFHRSGKGSGTIGAAVALATQYVMLDSTWITMFWLIVASFMVGWIVVPTAERFLLEMQGPRKRHTGEVVDSDFNETNIDEFHGQLIAGLPIWFFDQAADSAWWLLIVSFVIFRFEDTLKPFPIDWVERATKGTGFGVMIDDTIAGVMSILVILVPMMFVIYA